MFWVAFAIGAGVLWLFAPDQFNRPSWNDDQRLMRVLSVAHLRGDRVRKRALFVYFLLLLLVYAIFVFFGGAIVAALNAGVTSKMAGGAGAPPLALPAPWVPFAVSLAMVGLGPRFELLSKIEEKIRVTAHELMGLPRGLLSSGQMIADCEMRLEDIGAANISARDMQRLERHVAAAGAVFGEEAVKVRLLRGRLLKLIAYKVWVLDGVWPTATLRKPYEALEADFATDLSACLADLDDIASIWQEVMNSTERDALRKRWDDRMIATNELCVEICTLLFIYFEKSAVGNADPIKQSVSSFFVLAIAGKSTAPELDMAIKCVLGAVLVAGFWGYIGVMLRPWSGLPIGDPAAGALTAALGALFLYGPAIALAKPGALRRGISTIRWLGTALACFLVSLIFLVLLNISQAIIVASVPLGSFHLVAYAAVLSEAPMATLGAAQGLFVLSYLQVYVDPERVDAARRWRVIASSVASMLLLSVAATYLVVAATEIVGKWSNPAFVRPPVVSDFVSRVPAAALIALIIGVGITSALASRFATPRKPLA